MFLYLDPLYHVKTPPVKYPLARREFKKDCKARATNTPTPVKDNPYDRRGIGILDTSILLWYNGDMMKEGLKMKNTGWVEVGFELFDKAVVGKLYSFNGRIGRVIKKEMPSNKNAVGMVTGRPILLVRWK